MKTMFALLTTMFYAQGSLAGGGDIPPAQQEVIAAELAFVRLAGERGFRDSFFRYLTDDAIVFNPHPFKLRRALASQPSTRGPMGAVWAPVYGDISQAGDLAWQTGPLVFEGKDGRPDRHGMFFSVWQRQSDGDWRVVFDHGTDTPAPVVPLNAPFQTSHRAAPAAAGQVDRAEAVAGLLVIERAFLAVAATEGAGQAYASRLDESARIHRPGAMPVISQPQLRAWVAAQAVTLRGELLGADVSRSGDLGYAYGSYQLAGAEPQAGYYARVWRKNPDGDWRIVMDTVGSLPAGERPLTAEELRLQ